jgi:hypothetical protein
VVPVLPLNSALALMNSSLLMSVSDDELAFIASSDYGQGKEQHLEALRALIFKQHGRLQKEQYWYPYEVIELCSNSVKPGHEREFAICTLLVIAAVKCGADPSTDLRSKFQDRAEEYDRLPETLREEVLRAYQSVEC